MDLPGVLLQASIALGNHNSTQLPISATKQIQRAIYYFFSVQRTREQLEHTEREVEDFEHRVVQFLWSLRSAFGAVCKSNFQYYKFHKLLHVIIQLRMFGNLDVCDANRWEHFHIFAAKRIYQMTARRSATLQQDMETALTKLDKYQHIFRQYESTSYVHSRSVVLVLV